MELKRTRQTLDELLTCKAEGAIHFSNQRYYEMGTRSSRLLAFQLRKAQSNRMVAKIKHPKLEELMISPKDIAEAFGAYFEDLYANSNSSSVRNESEDFFSKIHLPSLTEDKAQDMIKPITEQEVLKTIITLKNNKLPGTDGHPGEFYRFFTEQLTQILVKVFYYALSKGDPPQTWSEAIISVLHKEGKDPTPYEGYRPIS